MSGRSIQVKAILLKEGVEDGLKEIRRFRVDEDGSVMGDRRLLQILLTRVHAVYNIDTTTRACNLYWKDEDDDLIHFSSEEELRHAVDNMSGDTLRIYVIITETGRIGEEPKGPLPDYSEEPRTEFSFTGQATPPPPPPPYPHHHDTPFAPPFLKPCGHRDWRKWKPMGAGGWKGGWRGGMRVGCPVGKGHGMYGCGWKGKRGLFKKVNTPWMKHRMMNASKQKEFNKVRQQVPDTFRNWVRQYVHRWYFQGPEAAAQAASTEKLPEGVGQDFPQWLNTFLSQHHPHPSTASHSSTEGETDMDTEVGDPPQCLPPVYFRWLCLFLPRFFSRNGCFSYGAPFDCEEDGPQCLGGRCHPYGLGFNPRGWHGKPGCQKKKKRCKNRRQSSSSDSEDSACGQKGLQKVPKGFRNYVRMSTKQLHKGKGDKSKIKEKATRAGLSVELQEFVEQVLLEWHAKLSCKHPHVVTKEMMEGERTLPAGLPQEHFQWLCRFVARWHRWHAGKCDFMSGWSSGETVTDDTSEDETTPSGQGCGLYPPFYPDPRHFYAGMGAMHGHPFPGMMGGPHYHFAMPPGMDHPYPPPPPPPSMFGCFPPPPPPPPGFFSSRCVFESGGEMCSDQGTGYGDKPRDGKGQKNQEPQTLHDDMVDHVTEGVRKM